MNQSSGTPVTWGITPIALKLALGAPWDDAAAMAITEWNAIVPLLTINPQAKNSVKWAMPGSLPSWMNAVTASTYGLRDNRQVYSEATIEVNPDLCWAIYNGPLRTGMCHGAYAVIYDIQRTILHELGHVLGLGHPDEGGQEVESIMNNRVTALDTLTADDMAGLYALYAPAPSIALSGTPGGTTTSALHANSGGSGGGGCTMASTQEGFDPMFVILFVISSAYTIRRIRG
jgi:hypothetical protein